MTDVPASLASAREQFLTMVEAIRPELHRYCARLTGSVIEGEDIVQDTLAKAFYTLSMAPELPPLRPWLFRVAHNAAIDFLRSHGRKMTDPRDDLDTLADAGEQADPFAIRAALARFLELPLAQRSAVILKDVLGQSLDEIAATMGTSVMAVKAALVRGRGKLREAEGGDMQSQPELARPAPHAQLERYAQLFNARDWDGVRALIGEDCRLDLVSKSQRRGKAVGMYFGRYEREAVRLAVAELDGELVLAAFVGDATAPAYFIVVEWDGGQVVGIRDFRYVPYIASDARYALR